MPPIVAQDRGLRRAFGLRLKEFRKQRGWSQKELALRLGVRCHLADFTRGTEVPFAAALDDLIELVSDAATELGTRDEVEQVRRIVSDGTSAERQLAVYHASHDPREVVAWLLRETERDIPLG